MKKSIPIPLLVLILLPAHVVAEETEVRFCVTGLFQPDRKDDLIQQAKNWTEARLVSVDYETTVAVFAYDPKSKLFNNAKPEQVRERLDNLLRQGSFGSFTLRPLSALSLEKQQKLEIGVVGHDCKGCAFGAYLAVYNIEGVERATVSFKQGLVTAWIDPAKTNRTALEEALKKKEVTLKPR